MHNYAHHQETDWINKAASGVSLDVLAAVVCRRDMSWVHCVNVGIPKHVELKVNKHLYLCHPLVLSSPMLMMHGHMNMKLPWHVLCSFQSPQYRSSPSRFPSQSSHRERQSIYRAIFYCLSKSPVNKPLLQVPQWGPNGERCPFPEPSFTYPSGSPVKDPFLPVPLAELP